MVSWEDVIKSRARASGKPSCVKNMRESKEIDAIMISESHSKGPRQLEYNHKKMAAAMDRKQ